MSEGREGLFLCAMSDNKNNNKGDSSNIGRRRWVRGTFKLKDNLRRWLDCHHPPWTSKQLAERIGFHESYVSLVFRGLRPPSWAFLREIAELTGLYDGGELVYYDPQGTEMKERSAERSKGVKTR